MGFVLIFLSDNPLGKTSAFDYWLFFSPTVGVVLPVTLKLLEQKRYSLASWLAALAPFTGLLNVALCFLIAGVTGIDPGYWSLPTIAAIVIWVWPMIILLKKLFREEKPSMTEEGV